MQKSEARNLGGALPGNQNARRFDEPLVTMNIKAPAKDKMKYTAAAKREGMSLSAWVRRELDRAAGEKR